MTNENTVREITNDWNINKELICWNALAFKLNFWLKVIFKNCDVLGI